MTQSESEIKSLLSSQSYSPSLVAPLEAYVDAQLSGEAPYIFESVRTLIKCYLLFPQTLQSNEKIGQACWLALLNYGNTSTTHDFLALTYITPPMMIKSYPTLATLRACAQALDACQFQVFWKEYAKLLSEEEGENSSSSIAASAKKSVTRIQAAILQVLAWTYQQAPTPFVVKALNLTSADEIMNISASSTSSSGRVVVQLVTADTVTFEPTSDNTKRQRVFQEGLAFSGITDLLGYKTKVHSQ